MSSIPAEVIDNKIEAGKKFLENVEKLKTELGLTNTGEFVKKIKHLSPEQIKDNLFLQDFMGSDIYKHFTVKRIQIGTFGRKVGYSYEPIKEQYFRFIIHLGDSEVYYVDSTQEKDKMMPMHDGYGFIVSSLLAPCTKVTVYPDPIRLIHDPKIQTQIPKIRPRKYSRTTLVYDLEMDIEEMLKEIEENNKQIEEERSKETESKE